MTKRGKTGNVTTTKTVTTITKKAPSKKKTTKRVTKKPIKKTTTSKLTISKEYKQTMDLLMENNVALQRRILDLTESISNMNKRMDNFMHMVEKASTEVMLEEKQEQVKDSIEEKGTDKLIDKLENLIQQNKIIARGLILLEKFVREKTNDTKPSDKFKPLPEFKF